MERVSKDHDWKKRLQDSVHRDSVRRASINVLVTLNRSAGCVYCSVFNVTCRKSGIIREIVAGRPSYAPAEPKFRRQAKRRVSSA